MPMAASPATAPLVTTNQLRKAIVYLSLWAGVLLTALLPIGMFSGLRSGYFESFFYVHLVSLGLAVCFSLWLFGRCSLRSMMSPVFSLGALFLFLAIIALESLHPVIARDALIHHLAVPRWWVQAGRILQISWHEWSHYPMLVNLGYTGLMLEGWDRYASIYHAAYLLIACGVAAGFVLYKTQDYSIAAATYLLFLSIPVCTRLAGAPLVDLGLSLYSVLAFCHVIYWAEGKRRMLHLLIAGLASGLALGCKYNGLLMLALLLGALIPFALLSKISLGAALRACMLIGLVALLVYAPWVMKNIAWTNNPLYPLFNSYFSVATGPQTPRSINPIDQRMLLYGESIGDIVAIPLRMLFAGEDGNPRKFDGVLSPVLLFALVPLLRFFKDPWVLFSWVFLAGYLVLALILSSARVRYLAPLFGPVMIVASIGIWQLTSRLPARGRYSGFVLVIVMSLGWGCWHAGRMLSDSAAIEWAEGRDDKTSYLRKHIAEYPAIEYINSNVPAESVTYLLNTGNRFYYFDKRVTSSGHFSAAQILTWIRSSSSSDFLYSEFKNRAIDYLMSNTELTRRTFQDSLSLEERALWNEFQEKHLQLVFNERGFSVWKIS